MYRSEANKKELVPSLNSVGLRSLENERYLYPMNRNTGLTIMKKITKQNAIEIKLAQHVKLKDSYSEYFKIQRKLS